MAKIVVLEWNAASLGGRQRTMIRFADAAKSLGHNVCLWTNNLEEHRRRLCFLEDIPLTCLTSKDVFLDGNLQRCYQSPSQLPREFRQADCLFVPYGGYVYLKDLLPCVSLVAWVIHPAQTRQQTRPIAVWTNSQTTKRWLQASGRWASPEPTVVIPPHDYTPFRKAARLKKQWDVAIVTGLLPSKRAVKAVSMCVDLGLRTIVAGKSYSAMAADCQVAADQIKAIAARYKNIEFTTNLSAFEVAELLGQSRCLLTLSEQESAPLVAYEAMNAGCIVVGRAAGALAEQTGCFGYLSDTDEGVRKHLQMLLVQGEVALHLPNAAMDRGAEFDCPETMPAFRVALDGVLR